MKIILASGSPRRRSLLAQIGLPFEVHVSTANEEHNPDDSSSTVVRRLALRKAEDVASHYTESPTLVIGADTVVEYRGRILGKPSDRTDAREMLLRLSNTTHRVYTGVALVKTGTKHTKKRVLTFDEVTKVTFGELRPGDINRYVASGKPMDKAGAYGIQDAMTGLFVKKIDGDYYNVVGFPLYAFYQNLNSFVPDVMPGTGKQAD